MYKRYRVWHEENYDEVLSAQAKKRREQRLELLKYMGGKCVKCGFSDYRALQIDHVNGDGNKERKANPLGAYYKYLFDNVKNNPNKYQLLCANCNWIKRFENREFNNYRRIKKVKV